MCSPRTLGQSRGNLVPTDSVRFPWEQRPALVMFWSHDLLGRCLSAREPILVDGPVSGHPMGQPSGPDALLCPAPSGGDPCSWAYRALGYMALESFVTISLSAKQADATLARAPVPSPSTDDGACAPCDPARRDNGACVPVKVVALWCQGSRIPHKGHASRRHPCLRP